MLTAYLMVLLVGIVHVSFKSHINVVYMQTTRFKETFYTTVCELFWFIIFQIILPSSLELIYYVISIYYYLTENVMCFFLM